MIKINLVPPKEKKRQQEYVLILIGAVVVFILAAGMFWFYIEKIEVKRDLNVQIKRVDDESKGYEEKIAEVTAFEDVEAKLDAAKKNIKGIQIEQKKIIFLLDQVGLNLPADVWIKGITQGENKDPDAMIIDGYSFSLADIKNYYESLMKVPGLSKDATLEIKNMAASVGNNSQIIEFQIVTKAMDTDS